MSRRLIVALALAAVGLTITSVYFEEADRKACVGKDRDGNEVEWDERSESCTVHLHPPMGYR